MCSAGEVGGHKAEVIFKDDSVTDGKTCKPGSACSKGCLPCPTYKPTNESIMKPKNVIKG